MRKPGIEKIKKRNGKIVPFDHEKIKNAIWGAVQAVGGKDKEKAARLTQSV